MSSNLTFGTSRTGPPAAIASAGNDSLLCIEWRPRAGETASGTFIIDATTGLILAGAWSG